MYVTLHEVTWCMFVWCAQNAPRWQQFHVAPAMPVLWVHHIRGYSKTHYKKLVTHVEWLASTASLLESGEQRYIKAINNMYFFFFFPLKFWKDGLTHLHVHRFYWANCHQGSRISDVEVRYFALVAGRHCPAKHQLHQGAGWSSVWTGADQTKGWKRVERSERDCVSSFQSASTLWFGQIAWYVYVLRECLNPFTAPACKMSGLKTVHTSLQMVYFPVPCITNLLSVMYILIEIFWHAKARNKKVYIRISNSTLSVVIFNWHHGS